MTIKDLQEALSKSNWPLFPSNLFPSLFNTIIETHLIAQQYFVTSDISLYDKTRRYTLREIRRTGGYHIVTVPYLSICKFETKEDALAYLYAMIQKMKGIK